MPMKKIFKFLDENNIKYVTIEHSPAYTALEVAESAHIPGNLVAKTVMVKIDDRLAMLVLPASFEVDFKSVKNALGVRNVDLASEEEFADRFPDCEVGAMPPFGNLYDLYVIVAESLQGNDFIFFSAGSHKKLIKLAYKDFKKLVDPKVVKFSFKHS